MASFVPTLDDGKYRAHAFDAALTRLEAQVREVHRRLDRVEAGLRETLAELAQARFEEYR
jgi:hypothetical protein